MSDDAPRVHATALVEDGVTLGPRTAVWDNVHIRRGARIGADCIIGEKTYIAYDVGIGDLCKINNHVSICTGVTLGRGVMVAAGAVFTNDRTPRATDPRLTRLLDSGPGAATLRTEVGDGATVGANATVGPGLTLGAFCTVGMGAVVTRDVPPHTLVLGNPARVAGLVARDGSVVWRPESPGQLPQPGARIACPDGRALVIGDDGIPIEAASE